MEPSLRKLIDHHLHTYPDKFKSRFDVLHFIFAVYGSGFRLTSKKFLVDDDGTSVFESEPHPGYDLDPVIFFIHPWHREMFSQPWRPLAGCSTPGFKDEVKYFAKCIRELELTPIDPSGGIVAKIQAKEQEASERHLQTWKENIDHVEEVLLNENN